MMLILVFGVALALALADRLRAELSIEYPASKTVDVVDDYHGTAVADPYRWLEQIDSSDTQAWLEAQNRVTEKYLDALPLRRALQKRVTELWNYPKVSVPVLEGGRLWYRKNSGLERQSPLYFKDNLAAPPKLVLDPNTLSSDGSLSLAQTTPSPDGRFLFAACRRVLDMLRYGKFTAGGAWRAEYGAPSDPTMFVFLIRYSPLHNVKTGVCYPATLILTGDRDDRVVPSHSFKYSAALQKAQSCNRPVLLRVDRGTSHSYRPTDRRIAEVVDRWAFIAAQTGVKARRAD